MYSSILYWMVERSYKRSHRHENFASKTGLNIYISPHRKRGHILLVLDTYFLDPALSPYPKCTVTVVQQSYVDDKSVYDAVDACFL